jgi:hypothetical protein
MSKKLRISRVNMKLVRNLRAHESIILTSSCMIAVHDPDMPIMDSERRPKIDFTNFCSKKLYGISQFICDFFWPLPHQLHGRQDWIS